MKIKLISSLIILLTWLPLDLLALNPEDIQGAIKHLEQQRAQLRAQLVQKSDSAAYIVRRMLELGLWSEANNALQTNPNLSKNDQLELQIRFHLLNNDFHQAEQVLQTGLKRDSGNPKLLMFQAWLKIESWELEGAEEILTRIIGAHSELEEPKAILGRALLLQKKYAEALELAQSWQAYRPFSPGSYLLEADVYFWNQQPEKAEAPLLRSLELDPFNADARFSYGYAIWRRVDATQLLQMAAQWKLALLINPLHFQTHWHWGNGHTHLNFADYADPDETSIREKLQVADSLFSAGLLLNAVQIIREVGQTYPNSVLPAMHEASLYYSSFSANLDERWEYLEKAQRLFLEILHKKNNYGPAHNGLAAVIKSKRITFLHFYDDVSQELSNTKIDDPENFKLVFPDMGYYPGTNVQAMVWNQLYTSVVYFPFLSRQGRSYVIPPLHIDLAIAMKSPFFRTATTFDNRQWMDIRGVGTGAADIGYTERGAFMERNVLLHEFVHLFHGRVLTDAENRKIRALYYNAMKHNLTLDYYSRNNESEYFAQTYPAYFEEIRVHPLDFKSMNTTADLKARDPEMYQFLDALVAKEKAYLAGDTMSMASNWAEVYIQLSRAVTSEDPALAARYLDTALQYDSNYQPAYLAYARLWQDQKEYDKALVQIQRAEAIDSAYAPVYATRAALLNARGTEQNNDIGAQVALLEKAIRLEDDYQTAAGLHTQLRTLYLNQDDVPSAIRVASNYAENGPDVSTYLRDRRNESAAFAALHRAMNGDTDQLNILKTLVDQNPQNYDFRGKYSDALLANDRYRESIENIEQAQRILSASGNARTDFSLRMAEGLFALQKTEEAFKLMDKLQQNHSRLDPLLQLRLIRLLIRSGRTAQATEILEVLPNEGNPYYMKNYMMTRKMMYR